MSSLHVLSGNGSGLYQVVIHTPTPVGNNSVGVSWATALINSGMAKTVMTVGVGPGQISQAEHDQIAAGTVIEAVTQWQDDPTFSTQARLDDFNLRTSQASAARLAQLAAQLTYFGFTQ